MKDCRRRQNTIRALIPSLLTVFLLTSLTTYATQPSTGELLRDGLSILDALDGYIFDARQAEATRIRTAGYLEAAVRRLDKASAELAQAQKEYDEARARLASTLRIARLVDTGGAFLTFFVRDYDMKALRRQALAEKLTTLQAKELAAVQKARDRAVTLEFVAGMERAQTWALNRVSEEAIVKLEQETARRRALLKQINEDVETLRQHASELSDAERDMVRTIRSRLGSGAAPGDFQARAGKLRLPLTDGQVLVPFGDVIHPRFKTSTPHPGWTIGFNSRGPRNVRSIAFGRVVWTGRMRGFGNTVVVDHASGWYSVYAGLSSLETVEKAIVREGDVLGQVSAHPGESKVTLYFELRRDSTAVDPADYIDATLAEPEKDR